MTGKLFLTSFQRGIYGRNYRLDELDSSHPYANQRTWTVEDFEYLSVSRFKSNRRTFENVALTDFMLVDIDDLTTLASILYALNKLNPHFPKPHIIRSSKKGNRGRYQLLFIFADPIPPHLIPFYRLVHRALLKAFRAMGLKVDMSVCGDVTRFARNPYGRGRKNLKYESEPEVKLLQHGEPTSLSVLYRILNRLGYVEQPKRIQPRKTLSFKESFKRVRNYLKEHSMFECTQRNLAEKLGIPYRTLQLILSVLVKRSELKIKWRGNNKNGNMRRCVFTALFSQAQEKELKKTTTGPPCVSGGKSVGKSEENGVKLRARRVKIGERNRFTFASALEYRHRIDPHVTPENLLAFLRNTYDYEELDTFTEREMLMTIRSALSQKYRHPISAARLRSPEWDLIPLTPEPHAVPSAPEVH